VRILVAVAAWVLVAQFQQGRLYRMEREDSDVVALRAEGKMKAPAWAVREVLLHAFESDRISPYLAHRKVLAAEGCREGQKDLPGCRRVWVYERYEPPLVGARDYAFRMEVAVDDVDDGGDFELRWTLDESRGAPPEGATHMVRNTGGWEIAPDGEGTSRFTYRIDIDPGGSVPAWIVNMANKSQVPSVIAAVEEEASKVALRRARSAGRP
jgi:hypothetical protein